MNKDYSALYKTIRSVSIRLFCCLFCYYRKTSNLIPGTKLGRKINFSGFVAGKKFPGGGVTDESLQPPLILELHFLYRTIDKFNFLQNFIKEPIFKNTKSVIKSLNYLTKWCLMIR